MTSRHNNSTGGARGEANSSATIFLPMEDDDLLATPTVGVSLNSSRAGCHQKAA